MGDTGGEKGGVGGVDERSGSTVELSKEDEEEGKGSRLGEVAVGTDGTLKLADLGGGVDLLVTRTVDLVGIARAKVDVGVDSVNNDVGREVGVVAGKEGRVCQRGLHWSMEWLRGRMSVDEGRQDGKGRRHGTETYRAENEERHDGCEVVCVLSVMVSE